MRPDERRRKIVDLIQDRERMTVDALADTLSISRETIRRDLTELARQGHLRKFHGGAMLPEMPSDEGAFSARMSEATREKRSVARRAATLFQPGDTLFVDTGSTTIRFAEELAHQHDLTVITNSVMIGQILGRAGRNHKIFMIGGEFRVEAGENLGPLAVEQVSGFHAPHAVITVGGIGVDGVQDFDIEEARFARAVIAQVARLTVIADGSKLGRIALFNVCPLSEIDTLVIDRPPTGAIAEALANAGVEVIVASAPTP